MKQVLVLIIFSVSLLSYGQSYQEVRGVITENFTEQPIKGVVVKLLIDNKSIQETISNSDGEFEFNDVEFGHYDIWFNHLGYKSFILPSVVFL